MVLSSLVLRTDGGTHHFAISLIEFLSEKGVVMVDITSFSDVVDDAAMADLCKQLGEINSDAAEDVRAIRVACIKRPFAGGSVWVEICMIDPSLQMPHLLSRLANALQVKPMAVMISRRGVIITPRCAESAMPVIERWLAALR